MESILTSIKKMLGVTEEYTHFDADIIMHINSVFMILNQIGIGPDGGFAIEDKTKLWSEYIPEEDSLKIEAVKSYVYFKVRLMFDPPLSSAVMDATNRMIDELEWRLNLYAESKKE